TFQQLGHRNQVPGALGEGGGPVLGVRVDGPLQESLDLLGRVGGKGLLGLPGGGIDGGKWHVLILTVSSRVVPRSYRAPAGPAPSPRCSGMARRSSFPVAVCG